MKIRNINIDNKLVLAPMEGVTDLPFRVICKKLGAGLVYTEFIASEALIRDIPTSVRKMEYLEEERPISVQIFGSKVDPMVKSAQMIEASGADIVDINYGCWVKKVVNHYAGAAFLKDPAGMADMCKSIVNSISIPLTVKTRIGWDLENIVILDVAQRLEQAGVAALAVHGRTRSMGFKGEANWSWIEKVKKTISIPIILNGDVISPKDAKRAFDTTGCDAVMIGRGAIGNPFVFRNINHYLATGEEIQTTLREKIDTCIEHLRLTIKYKGNQRGINEFRKHYAGYLKGYYNGTNVRQKLVTMDSYEEIVETLENYYLVLANENWLNPVNDTLTEISCSA